MGASKEVGGGCYGHPPPMLLCPGLQQDPRVIDGDAGTALRTVRQVHGRKHEARLARSLVLHLREQWDPWVPGSHFLVNVGLGVGWVLGFSSVDDPNERPKLKAQLPPLQSAP